MKVKKWLLAINGKVVKEFDSLMEAHQAGSEFVVNNSDSVYSVEALCVEEDV